MNKIILKPVAPYSGMPESGVAVGTIDTQPLVYVKRVPHADGTILSHDDIAQDLLDAVDNVSSPLFGGDWPHSLHVVTGLSPRATQRDRIFKNGLPPAVLFFLAHASDISAAVYPPRAAGDLMLAAARMMAARETQVVAVHLSQREIPPITVDLQILMSNVVSVVGRLRMGRDPKMLRINLD